LAYLAEAYIPSVLFDCDIGHTAEKKLMFEKSTRLTAKEAGKLEPLLQRAHATDKVATGAAVKLLSAFKDWIDAAHFYRHEAGQQEPVQPPLTLAVQMVSVGASFIRWLAELDAIQ
jgi:hypothetical protein